MKLYLPQIKEEFILERTWNVNICEPYSYGYTLERLESIGVTNFNGEIRIHAGTTMKIMDINIHRKKINNVSIQITKIHGKKSKFNITFEVELNDLNRMYIESSASQGVLNIDIDWRKQYNSQIGENVVVGSINKKPYLYVEILDIQKDKDGKSYLDKTKYGAYEILSSNEKTKIGEWYTEQTCKKHLKKFVDDNKAQFFDKNQKIILRSEKFQRLSDEIDEN